MNIVPRKSGNIYKKNPNFGSVVTTIFVALQQVLTGIGPESIRHRKCSCANSSRRYNEDKPSMSSLVEVRKRERDRREPVAIEN